MQTLDDHPKSSIVIASVRSMIVSKKLTRPHKVLQFSQFCAIGFGHVFRSSTAFERSRDVAQILQMTNAGKLAPC